jgi:UDP-N-acetyl-D-mannosaminuronic acid dehydrogenase
VSKIVVVGGGGHVGLPLALVLAESGHEVISLDISKETVDKINSGIMPFRENGADDLLQKVLSEKSFSATTEMHSISNADVIIVVIGTPVDEHLNPDPNTVVRVIKETQPFLNGNQVIILRSTLFPGVTSRIQEMLRESGIKTEVAFCPERILEGHALKELKELPQIIGANSSIAREKAKAVFESLGVETIEVLPEEAELAKLFTNAWRYIKFAAANQFYKMANEAGLDFANIRKAITFDYPRAADLPGSGFAAGPCLFKDTMQLAAFSNNTFTLGHSAMLVNEGLPLYITERLESLVDLKNQTVAILGMAFKGDSDDTRSSLSYKLKKILQFKAKRVLTTDPFVKTDSDLVSVDEVLLEADTLIIAAPHSEYKNMKTDKQIIDIWNLLGNGTKI